MSVIFCFFLKTKAQNENAVENLIEQIVSITLTESDEGQFIDMNQLRFELEQLSQNPISVNSDQMEIFTRLGILSTEQYQSLKKHISDYGKLNELEELQMIPGFEEGLVDCKAGDEKDLELKFPDEYQAEALAGKDSVFKMKVNTVSESKKPELDDDFFKLFGVDEGGLEAFRTEVRSNMDKELEAAVKGKIKNQVMDSLLAGIQRPTSRRAWGKQRDGDKSVGGREKSIVRRV